MTTPMIGLIALLIISLVGWAIAELKSKSITFTHSEAEEEGEEEMREAYEATQVQHRTAIPSAGVA